ncbi:hypothetical protein ACVRY7_01615 [Streptococcus ictaluri]|uniref:Uncharacterized protein n=1 Tax=Streptococcus ictaluri 707-05 TaxID=764299 RepID=G5JZJ2_9STRE|nr:hypothetical protein [Streptococcus ictaluri]EHI70953.1 hypothetical protein STRIC_0704 [Streptococcus ictaluri 707-05]
MVDVDKLKETVKSNGKTLIGGLAIIALIGIGYTYYQGQPKSILNKVKITFSGYDGFGNAHYNDREVGNEISKIVYKKMGFSKKQAQDILDNDPIIMTDIRLDPKLQGKFDKASAMLGTIRVELGRSENLSNGDKVIFSVQSSSSKSPIKTQKKTYTVKGLSKLKSTSIDEFLKEHPVVLKGYNHYGSVTLPKGKHDLDFFDNRYQIEEQKNLANGDELSLTISEDYLHQLLNEGKTIKPKSKKWKVTGLKEITEISNLNDLLAKNDDLAKSKYANTSYTTYQIEKQSHYMKYSPETQGYWNSEEKPEVRLVTVYKITETYNDKSRVYYNYYGYYANVGNNDQVELESSESTSGYTDEDLENLISDLKASGFKEYDA